MSYLFHNAYFVDGCRCRNTHYAFYPVTETMVKFAHKRTILNKIARLAMASQVGGKMAETWRRLCLSTPK